MLGTLCVPSSGETRALLSFADVNFYLLVFSTREKRRMISWEDFGMCFYPFLEDYICCMLDLTTILMHGSLRVKW